MISGFIFEETADQQMFQGVMDLIARLRFYSFRLY